MGPSRLVNRNVTATRGRTSMRLEPELWQALEEVCHREGMTLPELVRGIESRSHAGGRTSAVRVFLLRYFRDAASEDGHRTAGHGRHEFRVPARPGARWMPDQSSPAN